MFARKDYLIFIGSGLIIAVAYLLIAIDPADNGFGICTLWIAPPLLLLAFMLPVIGIIGTDNISTRPWTAWRSEKAKHAFALLSFLLAFAVYVATLEPTASLWDCSEFISSAYKLQVPHTPGTPLSLLIARVFSMFAFGDVSKVAWCVNLMSGVFSALTVAIVYYVIYSLIKNISSFSRSSVKWFTAISSFAGSLCLAFSDTFWFSAVEAETYGLACFFLMMLVMLILGGKDLLEPFRSRRLVLIFYVAGLAYCIHPMCLLALPILPFTWYVSKRSLNLKTVFLPIVTGLAIVLLINRLIAVSLFEIAFTFDLFFVNSLHFPFYSGALMFCLLLVFSFRICLRRYPMYRQYFWSIAFLFFGFAPYLLLFIRSNHNPPIDETNPENLPMIKAYMNRESYPSTPLLFGPYFDAEIRDVAVKKEIYYKDEETYKVAGTLPEYIYNSRQTILPRMYSNDSDHIESYRAWTGLEINEKPSFSHNLKFMFKYQLGHMYGRYLLWNFAGRKGDQQNSDWLRPWDGSHSSPFDRAQNQYWMVPFFIGILGAVFQWRRDPKGFISVTTLFLITGVILALYLNAPPNEPRERDYIYVGSFIAFSIWIGIGLYALGSFRLGGRSLPAARPGTVVRGKDRSLRGAWRIAFFGMIVICLPVWMLLQNYDDHDRSGRTFQIDNARNILKSCAPNSILFTGGDNDTFPLWYLQEVEGFRTDVRVMVLSYMNTDWYINQLRNTYYDSGAFNFTLDEKEYRQNGPNDVLYVQESITTEIDAKQYLQMLKKEHPALRRLSRAGDHYHIIPSRKISMKTVNSSNLVSVSTVSRESEMVLNITGDYISKNMLAIMDLIISNEWARPIHFNYSSLNSLGVDVTPYLIQEGPLFRLRPERNDSDNIVVDTDLSYRNIIKLADYSDLADSSVYLSYEDHYARMLVPIRRSFNELAAAFLKEGNAEMALNVLKDAISKLYHSHLPPSYTNVEAAEILMTLNKIEMADSLSRPAFEYYYERVKESHNAIGRYTDLDVYLMSRSAELLAQSGHPEYIDRVSSLLAWMD